MPELLSDFLTREQPKIAHIIGRSVLPVAGKCIIAGAPKSNKSFLVLNVMLALAQGHNIFDACYDNKMPVLPVAKRFRVLFIEQELGPYGLKDRLVALVGTLPKPMDFFIKTKDMGMRLDTPEGRKLIWDEVAACKPDVVIFDPLAKFHLSDENSAQQMGAVMRAGDRLIEEFKCAVIYIHHTGKENFEHPRHGGDRLRGSSAIFADCDTLMEVTRLSKGHIKEPILKLSFELRRGEPIDPIIVQRLRDGRVIYKGENFTYGEGSSNTVSRPSREQPYKDL